MLGSGEWVLNDPDIYHNEYKKLASGFYPSGFDAGQWVSDIKNSGAKYICITTRHHDGFSMFDTELSPYNIVDATPFKRDILKELADECHKQGIALHLYGMWDRDELEGGLDPELWNLDEQYALIHKLQPSCMVGSNHHSTPYEGEDIQIFERDKPGENFAGYSSQGISHLPLETCQTMNDSWGYRIRDHRYKSSEDLIKYLVTTAGRDANPLHNVGPRPDGRFPDEARQRLRDMGEWMKTYAPTVQNVRGGVVPPREWGVTTQRDNILFVHVVEPGFKAVFLPYTGARLKHAPDSDEIDTYIRITDYGLCIGHTTFCRRARDQSGGGRLQSV